MSSRLRKFSEMDDSFSTSSSVSAAHSDGRSFLSSRPKKRRKTNLNTRFARMANSMKAISESWPAAPSSHQRRSSDTSSATNSFRPSSRLGQDFSLIKMKKVDFSGSTMEETASEQRPPLPLWLQNAISGLASHHPLRVILPQESSEPEEAELEDNVFDDMQSSTSNYEETQTFAFTVPPPPSPLLVPLFYPPVTEKTVLSFDQPYAAKSDANFQRLLNSPHLENTMLHFASSPNTPILPFSVPGPKYNQKGQDDKIIPVPIRITDSSVTFSSPTRVLLVPQSNTLGPMDDLQTVCQPPSFVPHYEDDLFELEMSTAPQPPIRVYFDSPLEDPTSSDPMEPEEYELFGTDPEKLDFRWMPFDRNAIGRYETARPQIDLLDAKFDAMGEVIVGEGLEEDSMYASFSDEHGTESFGEDEFQRLASQKLSTSEVFFPTLQSIGDNPSTPNQTIASTNPGIFVGRREDLSHEEDDTLEEAFHVGQKQPND